MCIKGTIFSVMYAKQLLMVQDIVAGEYPQLVWSLIFVFVAETNEPPIHC